ncbi:MAG: hypothetical protein LBJ72_07915 [Dysgonamonadaceae bacterium]|jgi:hypothetical protein|nr:hypothetical protein [Dysgonamonadaceae bacterium]
MAITIKEIHVKTVVEQNAKKELITEEKLLLLKRSIVKEILTRQKRMSDWEKER